MLTDIAAVPGVIETRLTPDILAVLPDSAPPAPWRARASGLFWWHKLDEAGRDAARRALAPELADLTPRFAVGALIQYAETPVGSYREVIGMIGLGSGLRSIINVPFIAVDSPASLVGGRANWALPKTLAEFSGSPRSGAQMSGSGPGWTVTATPRGFGPPMPVGVPTAGGVVQIGPDGRRWSARGSGRALVRYARVDVTVEDASFAAWFPTGRCRGALAPRMNGRLAAVVN